MVIVSLSLLIMDNQQMEVKIIKIKTDIGDNFNEQITI